MREFRRYYQLSLLLDYFITLLIFVFVTFARYGEVSSKRFEDILVFSFVMIFFFVTFRIYSIERNTKFNELLIFTAIANLFSITFLSLIYFYFLKIDFARFVFFTSILLDTLIIPVFHFTLTKGFRAHINPEKILIVGANKKGKKIAKSLVRQGDLYAQEVVGFVDDRIKGEFEGFSVLGKCSEIEAVAKREKIDVIVLSTRVTKRYQSLLEELDGMGIRIVDMDTLYEKLEEQIPIEYVERNIFWREFSFQTRAINNDFLKRFFDVVISLIGMIFLSPLFLFVAIGVKCTSKGPVIYKQKRVGLNGKVFTIYKFRSMRVDAEKDGIQWAKARDPRVTPFGRFIRPTRLDELPQLFNVLKGDMSLVGPRPERPEFVEELKKKVPFYTQRFKVKPGLTGWAQIKYKYDETLEDVKNKLGYDLYYIKYASLLFDLKIILYTIEIVLFGRGAH